MENILKKIRQLIKNYYTSVNEASTEKRLVWCSSMGPVELIRSFGLNVYFPEHHGVLLGVDKVSDITIPKALSAGFSSSVCSYLTSDIGSSLLNKTPLINRFNLSGIPQPYFMVASTNQCSDIAIWFEYYREKLNTPLYIIPGWRYLDEIRQEHIIGYREELKKLSNLLENNFTIKFNIEKFKQCIEYSRQISNLWQEILNSSIDFFDALLLMAPAVVLRGTKEGVDIYQETLEFLRNKHNKTEKLNNKQKIRLYWDGMPIWTEFKKLKEIFSYYNMDIVASTYCNSWIFSSLDAKNPFSSLAKALNELFIVKSISQKEIYLKNMIKKFNVNGMVFHNSRTCPNNSNGNYTLPLKIQNEIPVLTIEADFNDSRAVAWNQIETKVESFRELF